MAPPESRCLTHRHQSHPSQNAVRHGADLRPEQAGSQAAPGKAGMHRQIVNEQMVWFLTRRERHIEPRGRARPRVPEQIPPDPPRLFSDETAGWRSQPMGAQNRNRFMMG